MSVAQQQRVVHYPHSDGKPMAETPAHLEAMIYLITALQAYFAEQEDVYVAGNQFLYWIEGNPRQRVAPDVYVVFGVPKRPPRPTWKVWEEGKAPDVIFELTSRSTAGEDLERKYRLYQRLGVKEYIMIDVTREYLIEPILLHRLAGNEYEQVPNERPNDREWWVTSEQLGLRVMVRAEDAGYLVRLWDPQRQMFLPSIREVTEEMLQLYEQLEQTRQQEAEWRRQAEEEARRAEAEALRAQEEARRRMELEARLREVEEELRRLRGDGQRAEG
ncbi:MAG: Uma2 family endonuclease [Armatimonadota bacterium]|nr:Uma2 family endonuclease [Armatimonadota bacterium]MDW8289423.1 Uma2 family endonuclease [Armatimonadota bacterium]